MVSELDTEWCANEDTEPSSRVDCEISYRLERGTKHSLERCGNLSLVVDLSGYKWCQSQPLDQCKVLVGVGIEPLHR